MRVGYPFGGFVVPLSPIIQYVYELDCQIPLNTITRRGLDLQDAPHVRGDIYALFDGFGPTTISAIAPDGHTLRVPE